MTKDWMKDDALKEIDQNKLDFLQSLVSETQSLKKEQLLPFFMAVSNRAKAQNMSLSSEERNLIISVIKKHSTKEELDKINKLIK